jgi:hypothetical protein
MIHLGLLTTVEERHDCMTAVAEPEHYPAALDIHPVVAEYERYSAEPRLGSVVVVVAAAVGPLLRTHKALVVAQGVGPVAVQGTHAGPVAWTDQLCFFRRFRCHPPTCCPPSIAPYVPGLYAPAACCCGWLHCWLGGWLWVGGAH